VGIPVDLDLDQLRRDITQAQAEVNRLSGLNPTIGFGRLEANLRDALRGADDELDRLRNRIRELGGVSQAPDDLIQGLEQAAARASDLQRQLGQISRQRIIVSPSVELEQARRRLADLEGEFTAFSRRQFTTRVEAQAAFTVDREGLARQVNEARSAAELVGRAPILFQLDAEEAVLRRKIAEVRIELESLRNEGVELVFRAREAELTQAIESSRARLESLTNRRWTAEIQVLIDQERGRLATLEATLSRLDRTVVEPEVRTQIEDSTLQLARYTVALDKLDQRRVRTVAELSVDDARAEAAFRDFVNRQRNKVIPVSVDVDRSRLSRTVSTIGSVLGTVARGISSTIGPALTTVFDRGGQAAAIGLQAVLGGAVRSIAANVQGLSGGFRGLGGGIAMAGQAAIQLGATIVRLGAVSAALAVAGAAITAAWGAVSTAIAAIPGTIVAIGAPLGVVMLGIDGIKKAAASLKPEFDKLKTSVSATFEKGLLPVFKQLQPLFGRLTGDVNAVAQSIVALAAYMTHFIASESGIRLIQQALSNVKLMIDGMAPGLRNIVRGFLEVAAQRGAFDVLTTAVNTFGTAFQEQVTKRIGDGTLAAAFRGLEGMVAALARGFVHLVDNGLRVFAAAAPGVNDFLNSLTNFFNRFDWESLGRSVGNVFGGIADVVNRIPQGTIDAIAAAFERLGNVFQNAGFQQAMLSIISLIPRVIDYMSGLVNAFARAAEAVAGTFRVFDGFAQGLVAIVGLITGQLTLKEAIIQLDNAGVSIGEGLDNIKHAFSNWGVETGATATEAGTRIGQNLATAMRASTPEIQRVLDETKEKVRKGILSAAEVVPAGFSGVGTATAKVLEPLPRIVKGSVDTAAANAKTGAAAVPPAVGGEFAKVPPAAEAELAPLQQLEAVKRMEPQFTTAAAASMHALSVGVQSGMAEVQQQFLAGMDTVSSSINTSFGLIGQGFTIGMAGLATTVTGGMPAIQAAFNFEGIGLQVGQAFLGLVSTVTLGMTNIATTVASGMPQVLTAFTTGWDTISTSMNTSFQLILAGIGVHMTALAARVTIGFIPIQTAFTEGWNTVGIAITTSFASIVTPAITTGMTGIATTISLGFPQIQAAFTLGWQNVATSMAASFLVMSAAVTQQMATLAVGVTAGFPLIQTAFQVGWDSVSTSMNSSFQLISAGISVQMATLATAVTAGFPAIHAAFAAGWDGAATSISAAFAGVLLGAVNAGMASLAQAVSGGFPVIQSSFETGWNSVSVSMNASFQRAVADIRRHMGDIASAVRTESQQMVQAMDQAMTQITASIDRGMTAAVAAVSRGVTRMMGPLNNSIGQFRQAGVNMAQALADGLNSRAGAVEGAARRLATAAAAATRAAAGIRSPSKVFTEIGNQLGEGLALGMDRSASVVARSADRMISSVELSADKITEAFSGDQWATEFNSKIEHSFSELNPSMSNKDVVGAIRRQSGDLDQGPTLSAILATLQAMLVAQQTGGGGAALGAQRSRAAAELGAF
jgi:hypothetical protein